MEAGDDPSAMNLALTYPSHPSYSPNGSYIGEAAFSGNTAFNFPPFIAEDNTIKPARGRKPGPKAKIKTEATPGQLVFEHTPPFPNSGPPSAESATGTYGDGVPSYMTQEIQLQLPNVAKGRGRGRGRARTTDFDIEPPEPPKLGKGRAATQGIVIQIPHQGREEALADQARKRRRVDAEEDLGDQNEILQGLLTIEEAKDLPLKRRKTEPKSKRDHHACDRCFRNKTKCHRQIDGKPPGKNFPCDYCTNIQGICTSAVADAKKPESYTVAEETQWKTWKFKEIITKAMEDENLRLRKEIASFEAKFSNQDRIHAALTSTLDTVQAHNQTLKNAVESAEKLTAVYASEVSKLKKLLRTVYRQNDLLKRNIGLKQGNHLKVPEPESGLPSIAPSDSIGRVWAFGEEENEKPLTVVDQKIAEHHSTKSLDRESEASLKKSEQANRHDVLQVFRHRGVECNEQTQLNEYVKAYFANVHPLIPVLHKDAFLALYRLHGHKAPANQINIRLDASNEEGQVVSLICAVLALGALSLVETRDYSQQRDDRTDSDLERLPHFGEAMGFYGVCVRILSYTHDTLETMIAFLLMSIFAIQTTDIKEAFRRLHQFQAQAIALNPKTLFNEEDTDLSAFHNQDIWPGVTKLVVSEMVKRSWSMFKVYLSHVAMELGRPTAFSGIEISLPTVVDDEYLGFDATSIDDYGKVPNPIRFILVLAELAHIVKAYSDTVWFPSERTRHAQISKFREIWGALSQWRCSLPAYLDWDKPNKGLSSHSYLKLQRPYLETQFWCVRMKLCLSIAHLDPVLMARFQSIWDMNVNIYEEALKACQNALKVIKQTIEEEGSNQTQMYHWEAVRATTTLIQILLRNEFNEAQMTSDKLVEACRDGVALCKKLVPDFLTSIEKDVLDVAITEYIKRAQDSELSAPNPEISSLQVDGEPSLLAGMPVDNMGLYFLHNYDDLGLEPHLGSHHDLMISTEPFDDFFELYE